MPLRWPGRRIAIVALGVFSSVAFVGFLICASSPTTGAASVERIPTCAPRQLLVTTSDWVHNPSTVDSVFESLPIAITDEGGTCSIGGFAKIAPTGVTFAHKTIGEAVVVIIDGATIRSTKYKIFTLSHGKSAYTHLDLSYPIGSVSALKKWVTTCRPGTASGFTINIVPTRHLLNRHVTVLIPNICTTGKVSDLSTSPLVAVAP